MKLADALRSGRSSRKGLGVQISPRPQNLIKNRTEYFDFVYIKNVETTSLQLLDTLEQRQET